LGRGGGKGKKSAAASEKEAKNEAKQKQRHRQMKKRNTLGLPSPGLVKGVHVPAGYETDAHEKKEMTEK